jgi:3-methyladenine DNA glycosylase/8-oxoguanine DNA glycosylase
VGAGALSDRGGNLTAMAAVLERDVVPPGSFRMPGGGRDGVLRRREGALVRLLHLREEPVLVRAWVATSAVRVRAESSSHAAVSHGVERMRFALGLDQDLAPFHHRFKRDPLLGPVIRRRPWLRPRRRPEPFEALAWAICEQLIDSERAVAIERRLVRRFGRPSACGAFRDAPSSAVLAGRSPAELESCGLSPGRAIAMVRASREVAAGRADLDLHEPAWRRLRAIPGIGAWTLEKLAFEGQGRDDQLPAGDLAYLKLVGRLRRLGRRATEDEVRDFFAPYAPYQGLAGVYLLSYGFRGAGPPLTRRPSISGTTQSGGAR